MHGASGASLTSVARTGIQLQLSMIHEKMLTLRLGEFSASAHHHSHQACYASRALADTCEPNFLLYPTARRP